MGYFIVKTDSVRCGPWQLQLKAVFFCRDYADLGPRSLYYYNA